MFLIHWITPKLEPALVMFTDDAKQFGEQCSIQIFLNKFVKWPERRKLHSIKNTSSEKETNFWSTKWEATVQ